MNCIKWPSIGLLHNVIATYDHLLANDGLALPTITYRAKVKLHGKCMGVQITSGGVFCQSKTSMLTLPSGDLNGFAAWANSRGSKKSPGDNLAYFEGLPQDTTVFGEWCGPGIQKKMAISKAEHKVFAIFAIQRGYGEDAKMVYEPEDIRAYLHGTCGSIPDAVHILPWDGEPLTLNYADKGSLAAKVAKLNERVLAIEKEDPWVKQVFGVSGLGEGLVFYPMGEHSTTDSERLGRTMFKAKGVKHSKVAERVPVVLDPELVKSVDGFVAYMVTDNRLEQALEETCPEGASMRYTLDFLSWLTADVKKEGTVELQKAGLEWETAVERAVQAKGRAWLREKSS